MMKMIPGIKCVRTNILPANSSGNYSWSASSNNRITFQIPQFPNSYINTKRSFIRFLLKTSSNGVLVPQANVFRRMLLKSSRGQVLEDIDNYDTLCRIFQNMKSEATLKGEAFSSKDIRAVDVAKNFGNMTNATGQNVRHHLMSGILGDHQEFLVPISALAAVPTSNGAAGGSGIVILRYLSPPSAPFRAVNGRMLVQDQDGWLLMAAYNHQAGTNPDLVEGTTPSSATEGFSHIWPGTHLGLTASDVAEVRFYCHTSNHNRVMHFSVNNDWIKTAILTGSVSGNSVSYWTSGTTKLAGHTAKLPDSTTHVKSESSYGLLDVPFYEWVLVIGGCGTMRVPEGKTGNATIIPLGPPRIRSGSSWRSRPTPVPQRSVAICNL